jgi:arylsulfatase
MPSDATRDTRGLNRRSMLLGSSSVLAASSLIPAARAQAPRTAPTAPTQAAGPAGTKPNIVIIWGDDIGITNLSGYSFGMMGYRTPNIDRIAREGVMFTDYYGEQSCTADRAAFLTGQSVFRTGLSKVGLPGADLGLRKEDPTIAELLKPLGYATGQFGKNHLGDKDEFLPTAHGFDEFYGNLYHLNAEEEPELPDYPKESDFPNFRRRFGPRGVIHSFANPDGTQRIEDTGPLTRKRMETIDDDIAARAAAFIEQQSRAGRPFFVWVNFTHMHFRTHPKPQSVGQAGRWQDPYHDVMIDHDKNVGTVLAKLDELGIADNTIVMYSTDNGPHANSWPDAATTPFRSEKNTNWEGAFRVPAVMRWPGKIRPGSISIEIMSHLDWVPTLLAAAGMPDLKERLLNGYKIGDRTYKVHLDGFNQLPYLTGQQDKSARESYFYFSDDGDLLALRYDNWKIVFGQQRSPGTLAVWGEPFVHTRIPWLYNLRTDPFERADFTSNTYWDWYLDHAFLLVPAQRLVSEFLATFKEYPPRQKAASFTIDQALEKLQQSL